MISFGIQLFPFLLQAGVMGVDEFYFHRRRGLPLWEQVGHPLDTLSVWICYLWMNASGTRESSLSTLFGLIFFSCLLITKDEWIHHRHCSGGEQWLHSLLFILHPVCLGLSARMWWLREFEFFLRGQLILLSLFLIYQILYWNILWKRPRFTPPAAPSTTKFTTN